MDSHNPGSPLPTEAIAGPHGQIERALGVLELLTLHANGLGLFEIADELHIPRSATHRILAALAVRGYVRQDRYHGAYRLTAKIASLSFTFLARSGVTNLAQPILQRLARDSFLAIMFRRAAALKLHSANNSLGFLSGAAAGAC